MGSQELDPEGGCMLVGHLDAHGTAGELRLGPTG